MSNRLIFLYLVAIVRLDGVTEKGSGSTYWYSGLELPQGYTIRLGGEQEEQLKSLQFLGVAFLGAILLIYRDWETDRKSVV